MGLEVLYVFLDFVQAYLYRLVHPKCRLAMHS